MHSFPPHIICETSSVADGNMSFKAGEVQEVTQNRVRFLEKVGISQNNYLPMRCTHGDTITAVDQTHPVLKTDEPDRWIESEVLVTQTKNLALFLLTADCQPVSFYDPVTHTIALAHISRATFVAGLISETVSFLKKTYLIDPFNLHVYIGPHIKKESYSFELPLAKVDPELVLFTEEKDGYAYIDLLAGSVSELIHTGINPDNILASSVDTGTSSGHYSYFMMKKNGVPDQARMATVLMMT